MIRSRRAVSMIELLFVMSACTVVLTLSSVLIVRAMRTQMQSRAHSHAERNALRLSDQFRRDVHNAESAVTSRDELEGDAFLRLQRADGQQVEYSRVGGTVLRLTSGNGNAIAREEYAFPAACELTVRELESPRRLVLTVTSKPNFDTSSDGIPRQIAFDAQVSLNLEASLGHDLRLTATEAQSGEEAP